MINEEAFRKAREAQAEVEQALRDIKEYIRLLHYDDFSEFSHSGAVEHLQFALILLKEMKRGGKK